MRLGAKKLQEALCAHVGSGWPPLCQDAKSFPVSNLAPAPLHVPALSPIHLFTSVSSSARGPTAMLLPPHACWERGRILSPDCVPGSLLRMSGPTQKQKGAAERVSSTRHCRRGLLRWEWSSRFNNTGPFELALLSFSHLLKCVRSTTLNKVNAVYGAWLSL